MQETVAEGERGVVFGVQSSVCQLMSLVKSLLVIALPDARTFGLLIVASWTAIVTALLSFVFFARRRLRWLSSAESQPVQTQKGDNDNEEL